MFDALPVDVDGRISLYARAWAIKATAPSKGKIFLRLSRETKRQDAVSEGREIAWVQREYARLASRYDKRWAAYTEATTDVMIKHLGVLSEEAVLDVGCGTGALLDAVRRKNPHTELAGVDVSPHMLAIAAERLGPLVVLKQGQAESLPYPDAMFDVVVSTSVFHFIRNPCLALTEMWRVLKPEGRVVITDWCDDYLACQVCDLFLRFSNRAHFRTYGQTQCMQMMKDAGFSDRRINTYKMNWIWGFMTARATKCQPQCSTVLSN